MMKTGDQPPAPRPVPATHRAIRPKNKKRDNNPMHPDLFGIIRNWPIRLPRPGAHRHLAQAEPKTVSIENRSAAYSRYVSTGSAERCRLQAGMGQMAMRPNLKKPETLPSPR